MTTLQQRTPAWHAARRGKLTCSNLGALLGQVSYTTRNQAYRRALGVDPFTGNVATQWGTDNEMNGIAAYMTTTGNVVTQTGLHVHPKYEWLAGSPDGLVGEEGMIEVKCPYYPKRDGSSRVHTHVPHHYFIQINALLEITGREWCDYISWTPNEHKIFRVHRDPTTFDYLCNFYARHYASIKSLSQLPPPMSAQEIKEIRTTVLESMNQTVLYDFWDQNDDYGMNPPTPIPTPIHSEQSSDENDEPPAKRQRLSSTSTSDEKQPNQC